MNIRAFAILAFLALTRPLDAAQPLFAAGLNTVLITNSVLYRIDDYPTAPKAVKIGETGQVLFDLAIDPTTQRFYAVGSSGLGTLYELNPTNGVATRIGDTGTTQVGLAFDKTGQLYSFGGNAALYRINKQTGAATQVGASGFPGGGDLAFDTNGTLYATTSDNNLIRLNTSTGAGTLIGPLGVDEVYGLDIDTDGAVYAGRGNYSGYSSGRAELYRVNKTTGAASFIASIDCAGAFGLGGLSFLGHTNAPVSPTNSIAVAVEVRWKSESNRFYQVQWRTNANTGVWSNLNGWVLGNGTTNSIFDTTRTGQRRFYRVQALQ